MLLFLDFVRSSFLGIINPHSVVIDADTYTINNASKAYTWKKLK